ncbi:DUF354 domain-containing protein [Helicobacter pametensis]|uniref:DUF354 domain-containing protein n=1 Tax=Helicobacter pametensis TaxID=95149 RepID=UPI00047FF0AB|nr:DUF354 domain-containing protein [Helicobacter pametensis]
MIWLDITDPKYVLFFKGLIPRLEELDCVLVTTRESEGYSECLRLLELFGIKAYKIGGYGGSSKLGKFQARLERQRGFLELFHTFKEIPRLFITGASVEGVQTAYGLGIPVVNFADTPIAGHIFSLDSVTILSRLTLPLSSLVFYPFVVPKICYTSMGVDEKHCISYDFIDVALWLKDLKNGEDFRQKFGLDLALPTILVREEEYKAHYVKQKLPVIYESLALLSEHLDANIVVMPRYESEELREDFGSLKNIYILEEKLQPSEFYPYIDLLIGGGGTMNLESCYLGIPTISTRSLFLFHDIYLLENGLMEHATNAQEVLKLAQKTLRDFDPQSPRRLNPQTKFFEKEEAGFEKIYGQIKEFLSSK